MTYDVVVQQSPPSNTTVYVGNLAPSVQQSDIVPLFQGFGYISEVRVQAEKGYAFVKLDTHQSAAQAIVNVNGTPVHGRPVKCAWGKDKLGSDTEIIASQANGVTSPPISSATALAQQFGGYTGWPYGGLPYGDQAASSKLTSPQSSYYAQYYGNNSNGVAI
jgi:nucleolysin TIA-1/TIAR